MSLLMQTSFTKNKKLVLDDFVISSPAKLLHIDKEHWGKINQAFSKEEIKKAIVSVVHKYNLPVPSSDVGDHSRKLHKAISYVKSLDTRDLVKSAPGRIFLRKEYRYGLSDYYLESNSKANLVSDYYHRDNRMKCGTFKFASPYAAWNDKEKLGYCLNALWSMKLDKVDSTSLHNCLALRQYVASQFRVVTAKTLYDLFGAERVLDTSMGWGDRLAGFCFSEKGKSYKGFDPNFRLHEGYNKQIKRYGEGKEFDFSTSGSEEGHYPKENFDFSFTSPPYFETERYGSKKDKAQSWVRYGKVETWLNDYLFETVERIWYALKPGGIMALNIADLGVSYKSTDICDPMNDWISTFSGAHYMGCLGLRLSARPRTGIDKRNTSGEKHIFVEPIWVWKKEEESKDTLKDIIINFKSGGFRND